MCTIPSTHRNTKFRSIIYILQLNNSTILCVSYVLNCMSYCTEATAKEYYNLMQCVAYLGPSVLATDYHLIHYIVLIVCMCGSLGREENYASST